MPQIRAMCLTAAWVVVLALLSSSTPFAATQYPFNSVAPGIIPTFARISPCSSDISFRPTSTKELAAFVRAARKKFAGRLRIRATRAESHSLSSLNCPSGRHGAVTAYVDTMYMNKTLRCDRRKGFVTAQAGMQLVKFQREVHALGLGLPSHSYPAISSISLGGIFSVAAHGSNVDGNETLERSIVAVTFVDGLGNIQRKVKPNLLHGALGLLGIVTELTFKLGPHTKTRLVVKKYEDDKDIISIVDAAVQESIRTPGRSLAVWWRASGGLGKADFSIYKFQTVPKSTPGEAWHTLFEPLDPLTVQLVPLLLNEGKDPNSPDNLSCIITSVAWLPKTRDGRTIDIGKPAVGWSHDLETSGCQKLDDGVSALVMPGKLSKTGCGTYSFSVTQYFDAEFAVPYSKWPEVVKTVKAMYPKALPLFRKGACTQPFMIRFGRSSADSLLAMNSGTTNDKQLLYISLPGIRPKQNKGIPPKYSQFWDEWEQYMLCQLGGRPHWGKNNDRSFMPPRCPLRPLIPKFNTFLQLQKQYDPDLIFEPEIFRRVKARQGYNLTPNCMGDFKCFCKTSKHCPKKHVCQPGGVFPQYRVCQPVKPSQG